MAKTSALEKTIDFFNINLNVNPLLAVPYAGTVGFGTWAFYNSAHHYGNIVQSLFSIGSFAVAAGFSFIDYFDYKDISHILEKGQEIDTKDMKTLGISNYVIKKSVELWKKRHRTSR